MEAWLRDEDGQLLAVYSMGRLNITPGADRDKLMLLVTKLFGEVVTAPQGRLVYSGGHRYPWPGAAYAGGGNAGLD